MGKTLGEMENEKPLRHGMHCNGGPPAAQELFDETNQVADLAGQPVGKMEEIKKRA
jgi:hypothetical protein